MSRYNSGAPYPAGLRLYASVGGVPNYRVHRTCGVRCPRRADSMILLRPAVGVPCSRPSRRAPFSHSGRPISTRRAPRRRPCPLPASRPLGLATLAQGRAASTACGASYVRPARSLLQLRASPALSGLAALAPVTSHGAWRYSCIGC